MDHSIRSFLLHISCVMAFSLSLIPHLAAPAFAQPKPPPDPAKLRDAQNEINRHTADINRGADALPADVRNAQNQLDRLNKNFDREIKPKLKRAKDKADEAAKAAQETTAAAQACDKAKFQRLSKRAEDLMKESRDASRSAADQANVGPKLNYHITNLQGDRPILEAEAEGLAENSDTVQGYRRAQARVQQKLNEQQENLNKVDKAQRDLNEKMAKAKEDLDSIQSLNQAQSDLEDGATWLENNCPKKVGAAPKTGSETYVALNNQERTIIGCEDRAMTPEETKQLFGDLGDGEVLAKTGNATMISTTANLQTIERTLKARGLQQCFVEKVLCLIMTPLTPFRGHDHEEHVHSGRADHDHYAPDPPWSWGVTPPEAVIGWEEK